MKNKLIFVSQTHPHPGSQITRLAGWTLSHNNENSSRKTRWSDVIKTSLTTNIQNKGKESAVEIFRKRERGKMEESD